MPDKLTDKEIVKAFQMCTLKAEHPGFVLCGQIVELINRLKAENEDYKALYEGLKAEHIETIKAIKHYKTEAYKEFAERVKLRFSGTLSCSGGAIKQAVDNLLKELVGEDNA